MENNNWEVKFITGEITKSLEYWEKQKNESMSLYKVGIGKNKKMKVCLYIKLELDQKQFQWMKE